jgi:hypothetical protein
MNRCRLLVEGQTEEAFANLTLLPHLHDVGFHEVAVIVVATKRVAAGGKFRGGITTWKQLRNDIGRLTRDRGSVVTTLVDFYGLPSDVPGVRSLGDRWDPRRRVAHVEEAIGDAIAAPNFVPHVVLHEIEALLYTDPAAAAAHFGDDELQKAMEADLAACGEPELIDEGPDTAPSKRIAKHRPGYVKTSDGPTILGDIGLPALRDACPHFDGWLTTLEGLAP